MNKHKKVKLAIEILCIVYIIAFIIFTYIESSHFNTPIEPIELMKSVVLPWIIFPISIILILAYYDNILAGIGILIYEIFIAKEYFAANPFVNKLAHLTSIIFWVCIVIPIIMGIIYIYSSIKYKKINK